MVAPASKLIIVALLLFVSSCMMVGPDYKEPKKRIAENWIQPDKSVNSGAIKNANWWEVFKDPTLVCLIKLGYTNNLSLQAAATRVLKSRAALAESVGGLYPQNQNFTGNLIYQRVGGQSLQFVLPSEFMTNMLGVSAGWELDFWGKYRRKVLSSDASFLSSYAAYDAALVSLTADIATVYITIRTTQEQIRVTNKNVEVQQVAYNISKTRYVEGETNLLDVELAKTELYKTKAQLPSLRANLQQSKDSLGVLLGVTPDKVEALIAKSYGIPIAPKDIAVGIPLEAIVKRPDVYEARLNAVAQSEGIGAIKATLFPALSLSGTFALSANTINGSSLNEIFNWSNRMALAGPSFAWPLLNYGRITNAVREQDAAFQESLLNYQNIVLKAQQEVQDNITNFVQSKEAARLYNVSNLSATKSTDISIIRYREGESDFTPVLDAERQQLTVQTSLTSAKGDIPKALVALYRSLGGGWQIRGCNDIVSNQVKLEMAKRTNWGNLLLQKNHQPPKSKLKELEELYLPNW
ncbi:MAG: efflux transporter outer membrane subunit [Legionellaceae bacterium]|nr:efflux transporter outer membrane subunit [Legionellaceae bacterium]